MCALQLSSFSSVSAAVEGFGAAVEDFGWSLELRKPFVAGLGEAAVRVCVCVCALWLSSYSSVQLWKASVAGLGEAAVCARAAVFLIAA